MPIFDVEIHRTAIASTTIAISANTKAEADQKALEQAGDQDYSEHEIANR